MLPNIRWPEIVLLLVIVVLLFGVGRISKVAGELGSGVRAFKKGLKGEDEAESEDKDTENKDL
ncbi:MAG: twin-arginine translocase TatA/TatE family subunit [Anaerolineaceae bacterium]|jgi:sec-independent protein translocase protein TatA|nr:twin-arginine translocase TatA/TatE family subunit [Anaerolineaceae bacterium]MBG0783692.1 twin-arginine translocase TatA/TatE family subunit [Anaerolineaceae bacterium]